MLNSDIMQDIRPPATMRPRLSSNRMSFCNAFFGADGRRLPGAVSSPRTALSCRMAGLRRGTFLCVKRTHRLVRADSATASAEWSSPRPGRNASARRKTDAGGFGSGQGFSYALEGLTGFQPINQSSSKSSAIKLWLSQASFGIALPRRNLNAATLSRSSPTVHSKLISNHLLSAR